VHITGKFISGAKTAQRHRITPFMACHRHVQYFMWYLCLFPLVLPSTRMKFRWLGLCLILTWVGTQAAWLYFAYHLEFEGQNTFFSLWLAGLAFFASNCWIVVELINNHRFENVFGASGRIRWCWGSGNPPTANSRSNPSTKVNSQ
jgi:phosphatidylinositol glycan class M